MYREKVNFVAVIYQINQVIKFTVTNKTLIFIIEDNEIGTTY